MNPPSPALVAQSAVRRLPRLALWLLCLAFVLPGFVGREPWRSADIMGFGVMWEMAQGTASWWNPQLLGYPTIDALLPYWLGAWAIQLSPPWLLPDVAVRIPFVLLLAAVLLATWNAVYGLARTPQAQPVLFAFGGEARPTDYARAMADGGLLALLACLGLALLAHETSSALAQLAFVALSFFAVVHLLRGKSFAGITLLVGLVGLALSGAPTVATLLGLGSTAIVGFGPAIPHGKNTDPDYSNPGAALLTPSSWPNAGIATLIALCTAGAAGLAYSLDLWQWRLESPRGDFQSAKGLARLLLWFGWPATPLAAWTLWRWRRLWRSPHLALPLWFLTVALGTTLCTPSADRSLLLGLPALAALAAFALPTLSRTVTALIDWFTLLFFSGWAIVVWVVWIAMQTGVPAQPAANVARLAPGFVPAFSPLALAVALTATLAWIALVRWRVGRHRAAIWKSLVLPAGGATLGWVLVMTLLLGPLNFSLSNTRLVEQLKAVIDPTPGCVEAHSLSAGLVTSLRYHGKVQVEDQDSDCPWLLSNDNPADLGPGVNTLRWVQQGPVLSGPRGGEAVQAYRRLSTADK